MTGQDQQYLQLGCDASFHGVDEFEHINTYATINGEVNIISDGDDTSTESEQSTFDIN